MMKTIILLILSFTISSFACDDGFVKNNHLQIPPNSFLAGDMTEEQYKSTLKHFEKYFGQMVDSEHRAELQIIISWSSNTVNAYAERDDDNWIITVYGGLARHKAITVDGLNLVLCHELGHHLGGYPKKTTNRWSSAEGQADYYGTMKCLRRLWEKEDNTTLVRSLSIPTLVKDQCAKSYSNENEKAICMRMALAGKSVALMIQDLDHDSIEPKFETPDDLVVRSMNYMHPYAQCRLDTFFNGAICPVSEKLEFDIDDETVGSCHNKNGDLKGLRPRCWFVPRK
jgi:hypothetical protein